jgi:hypothetical protein
MSAKDYVANLEAELELTRKDRDRLLEIINEICTQLDLVKEELEDELDPMVERAKGRGNLPGDFYLGLYPPGGKK